MDYRYVHFGRGEFSRYLDFQAKYRTDRGPTRGDLRLRWRIFDNPLGGYAMFAYTDTEIAATLTLSGRRLAAPGRRLPCFELGDGWTADAHRRRGLFGKMGGCARELAFAHPEIEVIIGAPNPQAEPNWRKHEYVFTRADGSRLVLLPALVNLARRRALGSTGDVEYVHRFGARRTRLAAVSAVSAVSIDELPFSEYAARTLGFPRMNHAGDGYLGWRFDASPDRYRHFRVRSRAGEFYCAIRITRLGHLPVLVVSEHFRNGARDDSAAKFAFLRDIAGHYYRNHAGVYLNARVGDGRAGPARYLRMLNYRYVEHRPQPLCYLFREGPGAAQQELMEGLRPVFQLSDCDVG